VGMANGFAATRELPALQVTVAGGPSRHSMPEELRTFEPPAEAVVASFRNGQRERMVHCNVELTPEEQAKLEATRLLARAQGHAFMPSVGMAATRYLGRNKWEPKKALRDMIASQEWRTAYFGDGPVSDSEATLAADLAAGIVYIAGRDRWLRPSLVLRPARIPEAWHRDRQAAGERLVRLLVFGIEYMLQHMVVPGKVEGGVIILDMSGLSASQVPFGTLKSIVGILANHYANRIFRFYIAHLPSALSATLQLGLRLLTERQREKLQVLSRVEDLRQEFALHQLEQDLGGTRPRLETFYPFPLQPGPFDAGYAAPQAASPRSAPEEPDSDECLSQASGASRWRQESLVDRAPQSDDALEAPPRPSTSRLSLPLWPRRSASRGAGAKSPGGCGGGTPSTATPGSGRSEADENPDGSPAGGRGVIAEEVPTPSHSTVSCWPFCGRAVPRRAGGAAAAAR